MIPLLVAVGALLLAAAVPGPWRSPARVLLGWALVLSPAVAAGVALAQWPRVEAGSWFLLIPVTLAWLFVLDLRHGVGARLSRPPARVEPPARPGNGEPAP